MWYFSWILGLGFALTFGILNAMWNEVSMGEAGENDLEIGDPVREAAPR